METKKAMPSPLFDSLQHHRPDGKGASGYPYQEDYHLAAEFIYSYRGSEATFNAYRREIERLLQWNAHIMQKPLKALKRPDMESFIAFCQKPPVDWVALKQHVRFLNKSGERVPNPEWRPFVANVNKTAHRAGKKPSAQNHTLSPKAVQASFAVLSSFFNYLIQEEYLGFNPVAQIRQKSKFIRKRQGQAPIRRLSELQWSYVLETAEALANANSAHERTLFIMNALYGMYLRVSELAASERWAPVMNHFFRDADGLWWFRTVGKGNKERQIAVSDAMLSALKRYRKSLDLPLLPSLDDQHPLLSKNKGRGPISSTRQIRSIVQATFDAAVERMQQDNLGEDAEQLKAATVHWLRHTGISDDVKSRPREHVRDDAGHGSSAITDHYIDIDLRERHASSKKKRINPS